MAFLQRKRTLRLSPGTCHLFQTQPGLCNPAAQPHAPKLSQRTPLAPGQPQHVAPGGDYPATGKASQERRPARLGPAARAGSPGKRHQPHRAPRAARGPNGAPGPCCRPGPYSRGAPPAEGGGKPRRQATPGPGRPGGHRAPDGR